MHPANQLDELVVELLTKVSVVLAVSILSCWAMRRRWPLAISSIWNWSILAMITLPVVCYLPPLKIELSDSQRESGLSRLIATGNFALPVEQPTIKEAESTKRTAPEVIASNSNDTNLPTARSELTRKAPRASIRMLLLFCYSLGTILLSFRLIASCAGLRSIRANATPIEEPQWQSALDKQKSSVGTQFEVALLASDRVRVPFTSGCLQPAIFIPQPLVQQASPRDINAILAHELTHVARRDVVWQSALKLVQILYWFHPLVWIAGRQIQATREAICDRFCVSLLNDKRQYANCLLSVASSINRPPPAYANPAMARCSNIETRLKQLGDGSLNRATPGLTFRTFVTALALLGVVWFGVGITASDSRANDVNGQEDLLPKHAVSRLGTNRLRHGTSVSRIRYSRDGRTLVTWAGGAFHLWKADTGQLIRREAFGPQPYNGSLLVQVDDKTLAVAKNSVEFSNGKNTLSLWDFTDLKSRAPAINDKLDAGGRLTYSYSPSSIRGNFTVSPDGKLLVNGFKEPNSKTTLLEFWPVSDGLKLKKAATRSVQVEGDIVWLDFAREGTRIALLTKQGNIEGENFRRLTIVDVNKTEVVNTLSIPVPKRNFSRAIDFSPDGKLIAVYSENIVHVINVDTKEHFSRFDLGKAENTDEAFALAFSPDGRILAAGGSGQKLRIWDLPKKQLLHVFVAHDNWIECIAISPDGKTVATGGQDNTVRLWDIAKGRQKPSAPGHDFWVFATDINATGSLAVTAGADGTARVWDVASGKQTAIFESQRSDADSTHRPWMSSVKLLENGRKLLTAEFQKLAVRDLQTKKVIWEWNNAADDTYLRHCSLSADGNRLAVEVHRTGNPTDHPSSVRIFDVNSGQLIQEFPQLREGIDQVTACISPNGKMVAISTNTDMAASSKIEIWAIESKSKIREISPEKGNPDHLSFSPDGTKLLTAGHSMLRGFVDNNRSIASPKLEDSLIIWDVDSGEVVRKFGIESNIGRYRIANSATYSPDGRFIISGENNGSVRIFDVESGRQVNELTGHFGEVSAVSVSADGSKLVSVSSDLTGLVWDLKSVTDGRQ